MLKFEQWPPAPGKVKVENIYALQDVDNVTAQQIGQAVGSLLALNSESDDKVNTLQIIEGVADQTSNLISQESLTYFKSGMMSSYHEFFEDQIMNELFIELEMEPK